MSVQQENGFRGIIFRDGQIMLNVLDNFCASERVNLFPQPAGMRRKCRLTERQGFLHVESALALATTRAVESRKLTNKHLTKQVIKKFVQDIVVTVRRLKQV